MKPLTELRAGQAAQVVALRSTDPARLERLAAYGLTPGSQVCLAQHQPTIIFHVGGTEVAVDVSVAREIMVAEAAETAA
jgi:Fe2+ transport system protein FeoA